MSLSPSASAREFLAFIGDVPAPARLAAAKAYLKAEQAVLLASHQAGSTGLAIVRARSDSIDTLLVALFDYAITSFTRQHGPQPMPVSLLALGGYGREELAPWSDIDVMFLFPAKTKATLAHPLQEHLTQEILYLLWDCGLKVGHSTRTLDEVFIEARKDIQTKTALLEARLVAGSPALAETFAQTYRNFYTSEDPKAYIAARLDDQNSRRAKFADTVFNQEPDVKNGVGGLRDYQSTVWMARVKLGIDTLADLAAQNYLKPADVEAAQCAYEFILRVRNELHFISPRPTDTLNLDTQPRVAENLGYTETDMLQRVEHFMQDYYRAAQTIFRMSKLVESRLALSIGRGAKGTASSIRESLLISRFTRSKRLDGFIVRGRELAAESPAIFTTDPVRLIRVFRHSQQLDCAIDLHLRELIRESLPLLTEEVAASADATASFRAILSEVGAVYPALALMHELGVLGRFIPAFDALTCLVQHEYYHRYTADVHTLNAIRELDRIFTAAEPITLKYREVLHEISDSALLYLTLLLHDIGKAEGIQGHAESGVRIAEPLLKRFDVSTEGCAVVSFVIQNHLAMARFWQKRDVDDPNTAAADSVGTLRPVIDWKDDLNRSLTVVNVVTWDRAGLFYKLAGALSVAGLSILGAKVISRTDHIAIDTFYVVEPGRGVVQSAAAQEIFAKTIESALVSNKDLYPDIVAQAKKIAATRYLSTTNGEALHSSFPPTVEVYHELSMERTIVEIQARDQIGLLYRLAKTVSDHGFDTTFARIGTERGVAIDTFYIESGDHTAVENPERLHALRDALAEVIAAPAPATAAGK